MRAPVVDDGGEHRFWPEVAHVRGIAHRVYAAPLGRLNRRRAVSVLEHHIDPLVDQGVGGIRFFARIKPGVDPHHFDLGAGVVFIQGQLNGVDVADHFGDGERRHVTDLFTLGHFGREIAGDVAPFIGAGQISAHVLVLLVAGGVFKGGLGELLGHFQRRVHIAE